MGYRTGLPAIRARANARSLIKKSELPMHKATPLSAFALVCLASIASCSLASAQDAKTQDVPKWIAEMLDSSKLPRIPGTHELYASKATTSFANGPKLDLPPGKYKASVKV